MSNYNKSEWKEFRENVIESDNYRCVRCGKSKEDGIILQVHHLIYHKGRKPWQYATEECETLCKGCHGAEHGFVIPKYGWEFIGMEDLGDLIGECEFCNNSIRYSFEIFHENWGTINVGTSCCDNLTHSDLASNEKESFLRYNKRKNIFISSIRWKSDDKVHLIKQALFEIIIKKTENGFELKIHNMKGKKLYNTLIEAKSKAFDIIENGALINYCINHKIIYPKK